MKKTFIMPSLEVKEFNRVSILTSSGDTPKMTNEKRAEKEFLVGIEHVRTTL